MAINLIPQEGKKDQKVNLGLKKNIIVAFLVLLIVSLVFVSRFFINQGKIDSLYSQKEEIAQEKENLRDFSEGIHKYQSHPSFSAINNRVYFSKLLENIEGSIPDSIKFISFNLDADKKINVSAEADGSYAEVSRFSQILKNKGFEDVVIQNASYGEGKVAFSIVFAFSEEMIKK